MRGIIITHTLSRQPRHSDMAPIPVRLPEEVHTLISAAERRFERLNGVEIPKLRNCTGPLAVQQTLAEELREGTALLARQIEVYHRCN